MFYRSAKFAALHGRIVWLLVLLVFVNIACSSTAHSPAPEASPHVAPRNVILFIADGGGVAQFTMGRGLAQHLGLRDRLYLDPYLRGAVMTHSATERLTDSASSATAYATGEKTYNLAVGVDTMRQPLPSVVDAAEQLGMATGIVSTSRITHATPASFSAHVPDRWMEADIADQQIRKGIDLFLGGGRRFYLPNEDGGSREDGRNLLDEAADLGYQVITEYDALASLDGTPVLGLFEPDHLPYAIDRTDDAADLATLTRKAIELLSRSDEGFFLMVEGSRIDHASHDNDAAAAAYDVIDYDDAFKVALDFARRDGQTVLIATSDHETGGLTLRHWRPEVLADVRASSGKMVSRLEDDSADARRVMAELAGVDDLTDEEVDALDEARNTRRLLYEIGDIIARRAVVGWATDGHTSVDVSLYAFGPRSEELDGVIDNSEVGRFIFDVMGVQPERITLE